MTKFGSHLRYLRKRLALTQEELGKILNVSASTIGMYERGAREPAFKVLIHIAEYFETSTDYLLGHHAERDQNNFPSLTEEEQQLLAMKHEYPAFFNYIQQASPSEINKITTILKVISQE